MPGRWLHRKFDRYLRDHGVISKSGYTTVSDEVHATMDCGVRLYGAAHKDRDPHHDPEYIRSIAHELGARQDHRTDAIRIAYGHIVLDQVEREFPEADDVHLVWVAYDAFLRLGHDRKRSSW